MMNYLNEYLSPIGKLVLQSDGENLIGLFLNNDNFNQKDYVIKELPIFKQTIEWLDIYFKGVNPSFTPPIKLVNVTNFQKEVLDIVKDIPYGEVNTYKSIAMKISENRGIKKLSCQAVGRAVGSNPILLIIPCHRVIGVNGNLVGFGCGIDVKCKLLELEKNGMSKFYRPKKGNKL